MISHYLKIAWRNIRKNKLHTAINVLGLSVSISTCIVMFLIINHEYSFDKFKSDKERIYRLYSRFNGVFQGSNRGIPATMPQMVKEEFTGLESATAFHTFNSNVQIKNESSQPTIFKNQEDIIFADADYFQTIGDYKWLSNNQESYFDRPFQLVLTAEKAMQYFNIEDPLDAIGRQAVYADSLLLTVSGIVEKSAENSDFYFNDFISLATIESTWLKNNIDLKSWSNTNSSSMLFVKLEKGVGIDRIESQFPILVDMYYKEFTMEGWKYQVEAQPLSDLHFNSELQIFNNSPWPPASKKTLNILLLISVVLLLIAAMNYINLETAKASIRTKEIGIKKTIGSSRSMLIKQYLSETFLLTFFALILSLFFADLALRIFSEFIPDGLAFNLFNPINIAALVVLLLIVSLLAGSYPAFVISKFRPIEALNGHISNISYKANLRKSLIVFQFCIAQFLLAATILVNKQIDYMAEKDLGFSSEAIVNISFPWQTETAKKKIFNERIDDIATIEEISTHNGEPARQGWSSSVMDYDRDGEIVQMNVFRKFADTAYLNLFDLELIAGRQMHPSDSLQELLINETFASNLGFDNPEESLGELIKLEDKMIPIVGVVKDFHIASLRMAIEPVAISQVDDYQQLSFKMLSVGNNTDQYKSTLDRIELVWKELFPGEDFEYNFYDESLARFYEEEQRTAKLMNASTGIAILISCLGLFGMATFMTQQRFKEIGIRKVLGAKTENIIGLLSKDFLKLVLLSIVLASPVAWYFANKWLENYSYHVELTVWLFIMAALCAICISLLTVSFQSIKAARSNPIKAIQRD